MKTEETKWLDFFAGLNTMMIRNEQEFTKFRDFLDNLGLGKLLKKYREFSDWQRLSIINNHNPECIIFEYQVGKGMTFGYTKEESVNWYGQEPLTVDVLASFYKNSNLFDKDVKPLEEDFELEK